MWERAYDANRRRVERKVDLRAALATLGPYLWTREKSLVDRLRDGADRVLQVALHKGCMIEACLRSPLQCLKGRGAHLERDLAACDRNHGGSSKGLLDAVRFVRCAAGWVGKGLAPFSGVRLKDVPRMIRERCR
jgi:hypothetical protein